jgi:predicted Fe-Mo cluster-binding NifX family protein
MNKCIKIWRCIILKVAVPNNKGAVNQHFGQSTSFILATVENGSVKNIEELSTGEYAHQHKKLADLLREKGVSMIIAGGIGEGASGALVDKGMDIIKGTEGSYRQVLEDFAKGELKSKDLLCGNQTHEHKHEQYGHRH